MLWALSSSAEILVFTWTILGSKRRRCPSKPLHGYSLPQQTLIQQYEEHNRDQGADLT